MKKTHVTKAAVLKALGHPIRYCLVSNLLRKSQNVATMVACSGVEQPVVSQHLKILKTAGILRGVRVGNEVHYSVENPLARAIVQALEP